MRMRELAFAALIVVSACKSAERSSDKVTELKPIAGFYFPTLHFRRPVSPAADPLALPGEKGFRSAVLPNEHWDCEKPEAVFAAVAVDELKACLESLASTKPFDLRYRLDFTDPLKFKIRDEKDAPAPPCLVAVLPELQVPREIVFQTSEGPGQRVDCYSTRIAYERDLFLGLWELRPLELKVAMPLSRVPADAAEMRALLASWVLAPFWLDRERTLRSRLMSDAICERCMGKANMIESISKERPPLWP